MAHKKEEKKSYTLLQNIGFALGNIWKWDKGYFLAFIPKIPLGVLLPLAGAYFPKLLLEMISNKTSDAAMLAAIGVYCLMILAAEIVTEFCGARIKSTMYCFSLQYQTICNMKSHTMDYENTENPKISDMNRHASSGASAAEDITLEINNLLINLLGIITYGGIIVMLSPLLMLLLVISSAANYAMMTHVRNFTDRNKDNWVVLDRKNNYLYDISSKYEFAKDIKLYNMRGWLAELMVYYQNQRMLWHKKIYNKNLLSALTDGGLRVVRNGAAYALLIGMLLGNKLDVGGFVFYFGAVTGLSSWLASVAGRFNKVITLNIDINRLRIYLDIENRFKRGKGADLPTIKEIPYEIEFRELTYFYPESQKPALDHVSLKINKGERLAIVGVNGAGKTTLVKLMCGLYYPTSGAVLLNGKDSREYGIDDYYTQFSAVFQDIYLVPISITRFISGDGEDVDMDKARLAIKLAGLEETVKNLPNGMETTLVKGIFDDGVDLSGGEKQKLMLARALYKDAPVVVLDEPTAALDPIAENELYMKYSELTEGKTSVYISHRLSSTRFCDRIIYLQDGKIAEFGSHTELMAQNGLYASMFNIQSHYYKDDNKEAV